MLAGSGRRAAAQSRRMPAYYLFERGSVPGLLPIRQAATGKHAQKMTNWPAASRADRGCMEATWAVPLLDGFAVQCDVEALLFVLGADAQRNEELDQLEQDEGNHPGPHQHHADAVELDQHLLGVIFQKPSRLA